LLAAFAGVALALAAVGLFAVVSYSVARRTRDRHSHGAWRRCPNGAGPRHRSRDDPGCARTIVGGWVALVAAQSMSGLVFEVSPRDPWAFGGALIVLPATALVARLAPSPPRHPHRPDDSAAVR
jgi:hypothetical protein